MRIAVCEVCGAEFETSAANAKFCPSCRKSAMKQSRKNWEQRTGYADKQREKRRAKRAEIKAEKQQQTAAASSGREQERVKRAARLMEERRREFTEKAESGDIFAKMSLAMLDGDMHSYWKYWAFFAIQEAERFGKRAEVTVGGVSVYDPNFADQIMEMCNNKNDDDE